MRFSLCESIGYWSLMAVSGLYPTQALPPGSLGSVPWLFALCGLSNCLFYPSQSPCSSPDLEPGKRSVIFQSIRFFLQGARSQGLGGTRRFLEQGNASFFASSFGEPLSEEPCLNCPDRTELKHAATPQRRDPAVHCNDSQVYLGKRQHLKWWYRVCLGLSAPYGRELTRHKALGTLVLLSGTEFTFDIKEFS